MPQEVPGDPCDYPLTRPLALILVALAARAISDFLRTGQRINLELTWQDLKVTCSPEEFIGLGNLHLEPDQKQT